jgi:hypothetical protein
MGGISYNVWLCGLCAGVLWFRLLCFPAQQAGGRRSSAAGKLGVRVRILQGAWMTVSCVLCYQLEISATGRYLVQCVCVCVCVCVRARAQ